MSIENTVFKLGFTEEVECYFCQKEQNGKPNRYKRGEAFLATAAHSPCDANANYICKEHLDDDAVIEDLGEYIADVFVIEDAIKTLTKQGLSKDEATTRVMNRYDQLRESGQFISYDDLTQATSQGAHGT